MDEILNSAPHDPSLERLQPPEGGSEDAELRARWEAAQELRTAQENWLARREVLEDTPRLTMTRREYDLLKDVGHGKDDDFTPFLVDKTRQNYGIPPGAQHASVDIVPDAADQAGGRALPAPSWRAAYLCAQRRGSDPWSRRLQYRGDLVGAL